MFEDYVVWLFETYASQKQNTVYSAPKYADDPTKQICDAIIVCGSTAILVEAKLATCRTDIRYSGDIQGCANSSKTGWSPAPIGT